MAKRNYTIRNASLNLPIDEKEIAYLAGLFDGEGCIMLHKSRQVWRIIITNTNKEIINWLSSMGGIVTPKKRYNEKHNPAWNWYIYREADIAIFLFAIIPYLKIKFDKCAQAYHELRNKRIARRIYAFGS